MASSLRRSCGVPLTAVLVDLGMTPISDAFVRGDHASASGSIRSFCLPEPVILNSRGNARDE